jgi:hypothetical protein
VKPEPVHDSPVDFELISGETYRDYKNRYDSAMTKLPNIGNPMVKWNRKVDNSRIGTKRKGYVGVNTCDCDNKFTVINGLILEKTRVTALKEDSEVSSYSDINKLIGYELEAYPSAVKLHNGRECDIINKVDDYAYYSRDGLIIVHANRFRLDHCPDACLIGDKHIYTKPVYIPVSGMVVWVNIQSNDEYAIDLSVLDCKLSSAALSKKYGLSGDCDANKKAFDTIVDTYVHSKVGCEEKDFEKLCINMSKLQRSGLPDCIDFRLLAYRSNPYYVLAYDKDYPTTHHGFDDPYFFVQDIEYSRFGISQYASKTVDDDRRIGRYSLLMSKRIKRIMGYMPRLDKA